MSMSRGAGLDVSPAGWARYNEDYERREAERVAKESEPPASYVKARERAMRKAGLVCPRCGSTDVWPVREKSGMGGAVVGAVLMAPLHASYAGATLGANPKTQRECAKCGKRYWTDD